MHPSPAVLIAYLDGEAGACDSRRIGKHLSKCAQCSGAVRRIQREREELCGSVAIPETDGPQGLARVLSAMAQWHSNPRGAGELQRRLRSQIEGYFGSCALSVVERQGMPAEELLGRTSEMLEVFLGQTAAQAVKDDLLSGLDGTRSEVWR